MSTDSASRPRAETGKSSPRPRLAYIDWARGIAVLAMIEAHTFDAWTRPADRFSEWFRAATILGGFAAPMFLWLAGVSLALSAAAVARREGSRRAAVEATCRRGLEIFILAFLFRVQAFVASPGSHPITLFRVDVLNIMGPAIAAAGVVWGVNKTTAGRAISCGAIAAAFALLTPIVRASDALNVLPIWVQWYIRPAGEYTTFTGFPWAGFVFAGVASGALIAAAREAAAARLQAACAIVGGGLVALGFYTATLPSIYGHSSFWSSSPTYFAIRVGTLMIALAALYAIARVADRFGIALVPLTRLGRSSLFVYWIHVELVYGYASWLWWRRLPLGATAVAYIAFCLLMYGAVRLRDRLVQTWRAGRKIGPAPETAPA